MREIEPGSASAPGPPSARGISGRRAAGIVLGVGLLGVLEAYLVPRSFALRIFGQTGPVEISEFVLYGATAWLLLRDRGLGPSTKAWTLLALGLLVAFEVNPGRMIGRIVEIAPSRPGDPAGVRWGGILVLAMLGAGVATGLLLSARRAFLRALGAGRADAWLALAGAALIPAAFALDRYHATHLVWNRGYRLVKGVSFATHVIEETAELLVPLCFVLALWMRRRGAAGGASGDG